MALITIESVSVPNWQGSETDSIALLIYVNGGFTAATGTVYQSTATTGLPFTGKQSLGTFYQSYACTLAAGVLTIPNVSLDSTTDSPDNPNATYSAVLWDLTIGQPIQPFGTFGSFSLLPSPTPATWAQVFEAQAGLA